MERVAVLVNKLQEQLTQKADTQNMLVTVQLLHAELLIQAKHEPESNERKVSVMVPNAPIVRNDELANPDENLSYKPVVKPEPGPVAEPMPEEEPSLPETVPVPAPPPEPEPIPHFVEQKPWHSRFAPQEEKDQVWSLDPVLDVPTLAHQEKVLYEINDTMISNEAAASMNDKLKQNKAEMSSFLQETPVRDLKKAISINDRHRFIQELFRGDETMYERSIKTINGFHIFAEAEFWIQRELKVKLGWETRLELVKTFDQLIKRRFS